MGVKTLSVAVEGVAGVGEERRAIEEDNECCREWEGTEGRGVEVEAIERKEKDERVVGVEGREERGEEGREEREREEKGKVEVGVEGVEVAIVAGDEEEVFDKGRDSSILKRQK